MIIMNKTQTELKKVRGFAGLLENIFEPLNDNDKFKEMFVNTHLKILINAPNVNYAALISIDGGEIRVKSIPNKPRDNLEKAIIGWNAYLEMDTSIFLAFAMKRLSLIGMAKKIITRKVKLRGFRKLLGLMKIMKILSE